MSEWVIKTNEKTFYWYMQDGSPVTSDRNCTRYPNIERAQKICEQLASFKGDAGWTPMPIIKVGKLLSMFEPPKLRVKLLAAAMGCSESTVRRWCRPDDDVSVRYLIKAVEVANGSDVSG